MPLHFLLAFIAVFLGSPALADPFEECDGAYSGLAHAEAAPPAKVEPFSATEAGELKQAIASSIRKHHSVQSITEYENYLSLPEVQESVEVLFVPQLSSYGHMALRVGDQVYENFLGTVRKRSAVNFMRDSHVLDAAKRSARGIGWKVSPEEKQRLLEWLAARENRYAENDFGLFTNNCSQTVCRALKGAGIVRVPVALSLDPVLAFQALKLWFGRSGYQTVYGEGSVITRNIVNSRLRIGATNAAEIAGLYLTAKAGLSLYNAFSDAGGEIAPRSPDSGRLPNLSWDEFDPHDWEGYGPRSGSGRGAPLPPPAELDAESDGPVVDPSAPKAVRPRQPARPARRSRRKAH